MALYDRAVKWSDLGIKLNFLRDKNCSHWKLMTWLDGKLRIWARVCKNKDIQVVSQMSDSCRRPKRRLMKSGAVQGGEDEDLCGVLAHHLRPVHSVLPMTERASTRKRQVNKITYNQQPPPPPNCVMTQKRRAGTGLRLNKGNKIWRREIKVTVIPTEQEWWREKKRGSLER